MRIVQKCTIPYRTERMIYYVQKRIFTESWICEWERNSPIHFEKVDPFSRSTASLAIFPYATSKKSLPSPKSRLTIATSLRIVRILCTILLPSFFSSLVSRCPDWIKTRISRWCWERLSTALFGKQNLLDAHLCKWPEFPLLLKGY